MNIRPAESRLPQHFLPKADADAKAQRAFWRGICIGGLTVGAIFILGAALT